MSSARLSKQHPTDTSQKRWRVFPWSNRSVLLPLACMMEIKTPKRLRVFGGHGCFCPATVDPRVFFAIYAEVALRQILRMRWDSNCRFLPRHLEVQREQSPTTG